MMLKKHRNVQEMAKKDNCVWGYDHFRYLCHKYVINMEFIYANSNLTLLSILYSKDDIKYHADST